MKHRLISFSPALIAALFALPLAAWADARPDFDDDAKPILQVQPNLIREVESRYEVKDSGTAKYPGDDDHRAMPPYIFEARPRGSNGPFNLRLLIQPGPPGHILRVVDMTKVHLTAPATASSQPSMANQPPPQSQSPPQAPAPVSEAPPVQAPVTVNSRPRPATVRTDRGYALRPDHGFRRPGALVTQPRTSARPGASHSLSRTSVLLAAFPSFTLYFAPSSILTILKNSPWLPLPLPPPTSVKSFKSSGRSSMSNSPTSPARTLQRPHR